MMVDESVVIAVPVGVVWRALADPGERAEWWDYIDLDLVPGGKLEERWSDEHGEPMVTLGQVMEVDEVRLIRFTWADEGQPVPTEVHISLHPQGGVTLVRIRESGRDLMPDGNALASDHRAGWRVHLTNLRRHLERT
ncbi:SRPBCC family protein [Nonomuraea sediminis]|uniref:SRPBCC family protein n=1 Tax=Nonomuraea sediminis TaxID=2835864 RepID=UPI001BDCC9B6|nr:SRPBCC domain-containing protein [Nonomuraea sediminis]